MESSQNRSSSKRAAQACARCRKAKRRCDKSLPECSLCMRLRKDCDYSNSGLAIPNAEDFATLRDKVSQLEARLDQRPAINNKEGLPTPKSVSPDTSAIQILTKTSSNMFPASFFLDAEVYGTAGSIPRPFVSIPQEIWSFLGTTTEIYGLIKVYIQTIHTWLPIVSTKRLCLSLSKPSLEVTADLALLLLSMRLLTTTAGISHGPPRSDLYWNVKGFASLLESNGLLSLQVLQSQILLASYEIGHSVFPSAYLLTGHIARLGHALGLHDGREAPQMLQKTGTWAENEERRRTWWAVMLLDRYVTVGTRNRPLATDDPSRLDLLPSDDSSWDKGEMTSSEPLYVSSTTSTPASWFQRTCQATHLLGRYIRHREDKLLENPAKVTEAEQLLRTLHALTALLPAEAERRPEQYGTPIALCYSALIHLCDPYACAGSHRGEYTVEVIAMQTAAISGLRSAAEDVCVFSQHLQTAMFRNLDAASPLTADCLYNAAATFAWLVHETGDIAHIRAYWQITDILKALESRWACATEFLKMLEQTKKELYEDNVNLMTQMSR